MLSFCGGGGRGVRCEVVEVAEVGWRDEVGKGGEGVRWGGRDRDWRWLFETGDG